MSVAGKAVAFRGVSKTYDSVEALRPTDLVIEPGEFLTLLGPSGSGKTTLLNLAAGYLEPTTGRVFIGDRDVTRVPPRRRQIGMVFQNYALFPHMSVAENVAYGLRVRRRPGSEIETRVRDALAMVQLEDMGARGIGQLSGGQQQRVALARALVIDPDVLLMDEPLGALDRQLRKVVQLEIRRLHTKNRRTTIYVTHDQEEALVMSDRIGLMRAGWIEQIGTADELYRRPVNTFAAGFLGESNLLRGKVVRLDREQAVLGVPQLGLEIAGDAADGLREGQEAAALIRPEHLRLDGEGNGDGGGARAAVVEVVYLGDLLSIRLELSDGTSVWSRRFANQGIPATESVGLGWDRSDVRILPDT